MKKPVSALCIISGLLFSLSVHAKVQCAFTDSKEVIITLPDTAFAFNESPPYVNSDKDPQKKATEALLKRPRKLVQAEFEPVDRPIYLSCEGYSGGGSGNVTLCIGSLGGGIPELNHELVIRVDHHGLSTGNARGFLNAPDAPRVGAYPITCKKI